MTPENKIKEQTELRALTERLVEAVESLPVEEWTEIDLNDKLVMIANKMQAQREWDKVIRALEEYRERFPAPPIDAEDEQ